MPGNGEITEKEFQGAVERAARTYGWRAYHTWRSERSPAGFPDLVLVRGSRLIFAELKSARGKTSPEQNAWLGDLQRVPCVEVYVWRPSDLEAVHRVLNQGEREQAVA